MKSLLIEKRKEKCWLNDLALILVGYFVTVSFLPLTGQKPLNRIHRQINKEKMDHLLGHFRPLAVKLISDLKGENFHRML